jgi:acyl-CoA thioesterase I
MLADVTGPVLLIGDSITDAGRFADPDQLGEGYVRLVAEALAARGEERAVVNKGIGGNRVVDLAARWQEDVVALAPSVLSVYIGINDTWRRYDSADPTRVEDFESGYRALLHQAVAASEPKLIILEPFVTPVTAEQETWHEDLDPKREAVLRLAEEFGTVFVPLHAILGAAAAEHGAAAIAEDGVHPTPLGSRLIADAWLAAFDQL